MKNGGETSDRPRRPTAHDVARLAGVSQSAVSRAFTPGGSVSAAVRARVMEAAGTIGYRPNLIARSLITQRSRTIGVVMTYLENQFYPAILDRLSARFGAEGYKVLLLSTDGDSDLLLDDVLRFQLDAVVVASVRLTSRFTEECAQAGIPLVLINRRTDDLRMSSVVGENRLGGARIAAYLTEAGHRRPAFIAGLEDSSTSRDRESGFDGWLRQNTGTTPLRAVGHYDIDAARHAARTLLSAGEPPDAIFCANDHMAFAALQIARFEFGRVPGRDISIIGFDDVPLAAWPVFDLTTYRQPIARMADCVVSVTLDHIRQDRSEPIQQVVTGTLVERGSARRP